MIHNFNISIFKPFNWLFSVRFNFVSLSRKVEPSGNGSKNLSLDNFNYQYCFDCLYINSQVLKSIRVCVTLDLLFFSLDIRSMERLLFFYIYGHFRF